MTIPTPPPTFAFLALPIAAILRENASNFTRFTYKVTVDSTDSEEFEAYRDSANEAEINLSALLRSFFDVGEYKLPTLPANDWLASVNDTHVCKAYTLTAKATYTVSATDIKTATGFAIRGGGSYAKKATDYILSPILANSFALMLGLKSKQTTPTGLELMTYLNIGLADAPTIFRMEWQAFDEAGASIATGFRNLPTHPELGKSMVINPSYQYLAPFFPTLAYTYKIRIRAVYNTQEYLSHYFTFVVDHDYKPQTTEFIFINSRGGLSTIRLFGEREDEHEATREQTERYISALATLPASPTYSRINTETEGFKIATGYMESWQEYLEVLDLFRAEAIWEVVGEDYIPVALESKKIPTFNSNLMEKPATSLEFKYLVSRHAL